MWNFMHNAMEQTALKYLYTIKSYSQKTSEAGKWCITTPTIWVVAPPTV